VQVFILRGQSVTDRQQARETNQNIIIAIVNSSANFMSRLL